MLHRDVRQLEVLEDNHVDKVQEHEHEEQVGK